VRLTVSAKLLPGTQLVWSKWLWGFSQLTIGHPATRPMKTKWWAKEKRKRSQEVHQWSSG
jgi:hypothetical protein